MKALELTPKQVKVLRWLDENQSHRAQWDGDHCFEISGETSKIVISAADVSYLRHLWIGCPTPDKIYGLNEEGRAVLAKYSESYALNHLAGASNA